MHFSLKEKVIDFCNHSNTCLSPEFLSLIILRKVMNPRILKIHEGFDSNESRNLQIGLFDFAVLQKMPLGLLVISLHFLPSFVLRVKPDVSHANLPSGHSFSPPSTIDRQ